jgi:hypothetical protein
MGYKAHPKGIKGRFMRIFSTGRRLALSAATRATLVSLGLIAALSLAACTTTEGTSALSDFGTFEREVMTSTLQGVGIIDREKKEETNQRRAPLVLPKDANSLPAPRQAVQVAALPEDSDSVQIDTTSLSEEDLKRLRNARVVDLRTLSGRPLTEQETRQLTARMARTTQVRSGPRPLYLPPEEYFTHIEGEDLVCMAKNGDLVPINHKDCPYQIRQAIGKKQAVSSGRLGDGPNANLSDTLGLKD